MLAPPITRVPLSLDKGFFAQRGPFLLHWRILGGAMRSKAMQDTRQLFLWSMGVVFLFAFTSLFVQIPGLYGPNGLLPVYNVVPKLKENQTLVEHVQSFYSFPSLLLYSNSFSLPPDYTMELICFLGIILSFSVIVFQSMRCSLIFLLIWVLYLSLHQVGQTFLYFQWDSLLLEAGIITVLVAPLNLKFWRKPVPRPHDSSTFWLVKWLLFRLMFASGVVKLTSHCPTWWGLTALDWHYESQCIPTPLAWYAHQLPDWFQRLSVVGTYYIEILVPFFFFCPLRSLRIFAFLNQVFFQVCIILTGNYNFFNLLTIVLCISLLDDAALDSTPFWQKRKVPMDWSRKFLKSCFGKASSFVHGFLRLVTFISIVGVSVGMTVYYFDVRVSDNKILSSVGFSKEDFDEFVKRSLTVSVLIGFISLSIELVHCLSDSLSKRGLLSKLWSLIETVLMLGSVIAMFIITLIPLSYLDNGSLHSHIPSEIQAIHNALQPLHFTSSYGLFRRMTGVGGRPELIIEGANDENGPWKEYDFLFKPGHPFQSPPLVAPHQPRLDWQMWFAALGSYEHNPWLVNLVHQLLRGQKEVLDLMAPPPFKNPPRFIRVQKYIYHYTKYDHSLSIFNQSGPWWTRSFQKEYLFSLSLGHTGLQEYLQKNGLLDIPQSSCNIQYICPLIDQIRSYSKLLPPTEICFAMLTMATILQLTLSMMASLGQATPKTYRVAPITVNPRKEKEKENKTNNKSEKPQAVQGKGSSKKNKKN